MTNTQLRIYAVGDRVQHDMALFKYGHGTVIEVNKESASVEFDSGKRGNFGMRFLKPSDVPTPRKLLAAANDNALPLIDPADWQGQPVPTREWFIDGLIPRRQVTILNGDGGVGKSLLALQIGAASAMGCETLGVRPLAGRVIYVGA